MRDALREAELLIRSRHSLLLAETEDVDRLVTLLGHVADRLGIPLFRWSRSRGLVRADEPSADGKGIYGSTDPSNALQHIAHAEAGALYHFHGLPAGTVEGSLLASLFRDAAATLSQGSGAMVITGSGLELPPEVERVATSFSVPGPSREEIRALLGRIVRDLTTRRHLDVDLTANDVEVLVNHLNGLTAMEAEKILTKAMIEDGVLDRSDIDSVLEAKRGIVEREGLLEYYPVEDTLVDIAGMGILKDWLRKRRSILTNPDEAREFGLSFPRGLLLLGIPGSGKSLAAKAVSSDWRLPLLKLDPSNLYNKFIGESERNFKRAMATADKMSPVVLWIDEIEKAFASGGSEDGGVSQRILGSFLGWMQERRGDVFIVATANDVSRLPPELLRKGRFDEIFFVDLPDAEVRREIFRVHLSARDRDPEDFDLEALAVATEGFSGAEIEQVVVSALYAAFTDGDGLDTDLLIREAGATRPLSVTAPERIGALRAWARERAVSAG